MKNEGALSKRFFRHTGIYRSDVSSLLLNLGQSTAFRSGPGQALGRAGRTRPAHRRDEFRPVIPQRVARQQCPSPLHRHPQLKTIAAANGILYHRTVTFLLTVCLSHGDKLTQKEETSMSQNQFPEGWDEKRVQKVLAHYDEQSPDEAVAEDEAGVASCETVMNVPHDLVSQVRELIAKRHA